MATFMVLVEGEASGWRFDREALTSAIRDRWPDVEIDPTHHSVARSFCWSFETHDGPGEVYLHEDGTGIYMNLPQHDAVRLAAVIRRLTPTDLALVFCDEGYNFDVRLRSDTTDTELIKTMNDT
ncbi:hypothetical protein [Kitasatospora purpeofusca]|uniref:hypothetical protein n=1 Tax=Kitasatospora purpeofusca TaxID=67352 RepID=UPI003815E67C